MAQPLTRKTSEELIKGKTLRKQVVTDMEQNESHEGVKSCRSRWSLLDSLQKRKEQLRILNG